MAIANRCDCGKVRLDNPSSMKEEKFFLNFKDGKEYCQACYKKNFTFSDRAKNAGYRFFVRFEMDLRRFRNRLIFGKA